MEEIRTELKLDATPNLARAFDWSFVQKRRAFSDEIRMPAL
jgi:hypothetical protein